MTRTFATTPAALLWLALACNEAPPEKDPRITSLQVELMTRASKEQAIRDTAIGMGIALDPATIARMESIDRDNTSWLKDQIQKNGWPSPSKVGRAASDAALSIVQHATYDRPFQRMALDTVTRLFESGEVDGQSYALLFDRVRSQAGEKQRYGTQAKVTNGRLVFHPMEDSSKVDSLRQTVGLPTLAEYRRTLDSVYFGTSQAEPVAPRRKGSRR